MEDPHPQFASLVKFANFPAGTASSVPSVSFLFGSAPNLLVLPSRVPINSRWRVKED